MIFYAILGSNDRWAFVLVALTMLTLMAVLSVIFFDARHDR